MSSLKKAREISVRIVIMLLHAMALGGGLALLALSYGVIFSGPGGVAVGEATIVLTYEIIMNILVFVNNINHRLRLLVDIILNFLLIGLLIIIPVIIICLSLILSRGDEVTEGVAPLTVFLLVILPAIFVITIYGVPFVVSASISWRICSIISNSVCEESRKSTLRLQSSTLDVSPPLKSDCPPASSLKDDALQDSVVDKVG